MNDDYVHKFVDAVAASGIDVTVTPDEVRAATRRQDLGITSLNIIMVVVAYLGPGTAPKAEWIPRLDSVDGILSVLEEIDRTAPQAASVT